MKFPFGRRKPKEKAHVASASGEEDSPSTKKRMSHCSDTESETISSLGSKGTKTETLSRRRGSDTAFETSALSSSNRLSVDVTPKKISETVPRQELSQALQASSFSKIISSLTQTEPNARRYEALTSTTFVNPDESASEYNITDHDRGWITEDTLLEGETDDRVMYRVRIFRPDLSFSTISCSLRIKSHELCVLLGKKFFISNVNNYALYLRRQKVERILSPDERPLVILKRLLEKIGYTSSDVLQDLGREDNAYYFRFIFDLNRAASEEVEHTFDSYQKIDLSSQNLRKFPTALINNTDQIVQLDLSNNLMVDLGLDFFGNCSSLKELSLSRCDLHNIPECVRVLTSLSRLDLSCNRIKSLSKSQLETLKSLDSLLLGNNRIEVLPSRFVELTSLTTLNLSNNRFSLFPHVICQLVNLTHLDISFNEIRILPASVGQLKNLQHFFIISNRLSGSLPPSLLQLVKLKEFDIRKNQINNLDLLHKLPSLEILHCDYNSVSTLSLNFQSLKLLHVSKNSITQLVSPSQLISNLSQLNLSFSKLVSLPEHLFDFMPGLEELILDNNRLVGVPTSIGNLKKLKFLSCSNNELSALVKELSSLDCLRTLDLHDNNISSLPHEIWELKSLTTLNISSNLLKEFPRPISIGDNNPSATKTSSVTSDELYQPPLALSLRGLFLGDNRLTDDIFTPISLMIELRILNLSYNILDEIPPNLLINLTSLNELYLSGNQLSTLPGEDIEKLRMLQVLTINGNRLQTLPAELGKLGLLHTLDVGNNVLKYNICNFPYDWNWNWNPGLRYLNLSGNKRLQIKHNISQNAASHLNVPDFSNLKKLCVLGVMDVVVMVETPSESAKRRIREESSQLTRMSYGIADILNKSDKAETLWAWDKVVPQFRGAKDESLFAIFDGRSSCSSAGAQAAKHLIDSLEHHLTEELAKSSQNEDKEPVTTALRRTFVNLNRDLGILEAENDTYFGAAGVLVYIVGTTLYVANAGDTVAVLCRNAGTAHLVSTRHTPWSTDEIVRIRNNKGFISPQGKLNDELDISRGFGHFHLLPLINANPSYQTITLTENDEFIILATRSLWDRMSYQTAVDVARMELDNLMVAAQKVRDFAITYGADDSITVMIIGVGDLFADRDDHFPLASKNEPAMHPGIPRNIEDSASVGIATYKRNRWRNQGPGSSKLARLGSKNAEAPTGWVALVFTDIKNSTFLWETLPTAMRFAVKAHNLSMRRWLMSLGGYEVKTEGDAFRAAFPTTASALLWCLTMQVQLLQLDWPQEILDCSECAEIFKPGFSNQLLFRGLSVRMGIHWGTPVCEPDPVTQRMDYLGHMVKRSDSVCNFADGGQISVSGEVVKELERLEAQYPSTSDTENVTLPRDVRMLRKIGYSLVNMGEIKLKGLENPEFLSLVFPKALAARFEYAQALKASSIKPNPIPLVRIVDPNIVRSLGFQCMRLERIAAGNIKSRRASRLDCMNGFLTFDVPDQATDDELLSLLDSLTTRIENTVSRLYLSQLDYILSLSGFPEICLGLSSTSSIRNINKLIESDDVISELDGSSQEIIKTILRPATKSKSDPPSPEGLAIPMSSERRISDFGYFESQVSDGNENSSPGRFMFQM